MKQGKTKLTLYLGILLLLFPKLAHAYLDPGTGSYFFQILMAGLLGGLFFFKTTIRKLKKLLGNFFPKKTQKAFENNEDK